MNIRTDAGLFPNDTTIPKTPLTVPSSLEIIGQISDSLSTTDIKKLYFLCLDLIALDTPCPQTLEELLSFINTDIDHVMLLKELLYHIKKYRLLKSLQTCQHQMQMSLEIRKYVRQGRLSLFYLCENIENPTIAQLKHLLGDNSTTTEGWEMVSAEDFFRVWLRVIENDKMELLKRALEVMKFHHLTKNLNYEESSYHVITPSNGNPCGIAIIFNHEIFNKCTKIYPNKKRHPNLLERAGTNIDEKNLFKLWTKFGFDVVVFKDITYSSMMDVIRRLTKMNYSKYSVFICCILTHGDKGVVYTSDNIPVDIFNEVIYRFNSSSVPTLSNKPKMFFIQACQGKKPQLVFTPDSSSSVQEDETVFPDSTSSLQEDGTGYINNKRDFLWVLSSIPSYMSFRDMENGSWFVNCLVEIFERDGTTKHVYDLLDIVNSEVSKKSGAFGNQGYVTQISEVSKTTFQILRLKKLENCTGFPRAVSSLEHCPTELIQLFDLASAMYLI